MQTSSQVRPLYERVKGLLCCILADGVYIQWLATLTFGFLAWLSMVCALVVLRKLDSLADGCCGCVCFDKRDYQPAPSPGSRPSVALAPRGLSSIGLEEGAVVASITIGGGAGRKSKAGSFVAASPGSRYSVGEQGAGSVAASARSFDRPTSATAVQQQQQQHVAYPPMQHATSGPMLSPRMYPDLAPGGSGQQQAYPQVWSRGSSVTAGPGQHLPLADARAALLAEPSAPPAHAGMLPQQTGPLLGAGFMGRPAAQQPVMGYPRSRAPSGTGAGMM
jgi:hypothetical protein